jgi:DNA modification methylase
MASKPLRVELIDLKQITPFETNARVHSKKQISKIARSMNERGVTNPVLIDEKNVLLAGHGRLAAAYQLGLVELPCIRISNMSEAQKRAYRVSDNQLALESEWDLDLLASELSFLVDGEFDASLAGFDEAEIDRILAEFADRATSPTSPDDNIPAALPNAAAVSEYGDLWVLGSHRLLCGNARSSKDLDRLMDGHVADMAFLDAPYNVPIDGHVCGNGTMRHREFAEASGEMSRSEYVAFLTETHANLARVSRDGAIVFSCIDWRHLSEMLEAGESAFDELKNLCVWNKTNAGMGTFYRSQHELVMVWKVGEGTHTNNFGLGERGRHRSNVWTYAGVNSFRADRMEDLAAHPTVKPVAMVADAIRDVSNRGQVVLDVFGGSGTTMLAAERTGRKARLLEIEAAYCDVTIRRWEKQTGKQATLIDDGRTFEQVSLDRRVGAEEGVA